MKQRTVSVYLTIQCSLNTWLNSLLNSSIQGITYRVPEDEINHPSIPLITQNRSSTKTTSKAENHTNNKRPSIGLFHNNMLFITLVLGVLLDATKLCNPLVWQVIAISEPHYHHLPSIHGAPPQTDLDSSEQEFSKYRLIFPPVSH